MLGALGRLRRRNTEIKRPGFHSQQPPKFKEWSHWGWGYGVGEGVLMGARDKGSSLPIPTLVPERKQIQYQPLNLSLSLSAQTLSGSGRKSCVKGAWVRRQKKAWPSAWYSAGRGPPESEAGDAWAGVVCRGVDGEKGGKPQLKPCSCQIFLPPARLPTPKR